MFGSKKPVNYLSLSQIAPILEEYLGTRIPDPASLLEGLDENGKIAILAATPQWTYFQLLDQYLVCQLGQKQYNVLLRQQETLGVNILPPRFSPGMLFVKKFFDYQLALRQYSDDQINIVEDRASTIPITTGNDELAYLKSLILLIQEFELKDDNPNYQGTTEEDDNIREQLRGNEELFAQYLKNRPDLIKQLRLKSF